MVAKSKWRLCHLTVILILNLELVLSSQEVLKNLTVGFTNALGSCKAELNMGDNVMQDFFNYWREDYQLLNRDFGCMVMCMAAKLDLVSEDATLHHGNAHEFAKKHGADDAVAKQLVTILHECEKASLSSGVSDECLAVLEIAKCFRTKMHELKWAPNMELVIEEVMTELSQKSAVAVAK